MQLLQTSLHTVSAVSYGTHLDQTLYHSWTLNSQKQM